MENAQAEGQYSTTLNNATALCVINVESYVLLYKDKYWHPDAKQKQEKHT